MADLAADQVGAYELALSANSEVIVNVAGRTGAGSDDVEIFVHSGNSPVYVKLGAAAVTAKDAAAFMVTTGSSLQLPLSDGGPSAAVVRLISAAAAVVSVART